MLGSLCLLMIPEILNEVLVALGLTPTLFVQWD